MILLTSAERAKERRQIRAEIELADSVLRHLRDRLRQIEDHERVDYLQHHEDVLRYGGSRDGEPH